MKTYHITIEQSRDGAYDQDNVAEQFVVDHKLTVVGLGGDLYAAQTFGHPNTSAVVVAILPDEVDANKLFDGVAVEYKGQEMGGSSIKEFIDAQQNGTA